MKTYVYALIKSGDKFLVLQRPANKKSYPLVWNLPGGKLEDGETEIKCAIREVFEETGLKFIPFIKIFDELDYEGEEKRVIVFLGNAEGSDVILSDEHISFQYVLPKSIYEYETMPYIKKLFKKIKNER